MRNVLLIIIVPDATNSNAELVVRMGTEGVVCHQLLGHLLRQAGFEPPGDIDAR